MKGREIKKRLEKKKEEILEQIEINNRSRDTALKEREKENGTNASLENCSCNHKNRELSFAKCLLNIEYALVRLKNGTYGFCQDCGRPIEEKRLLANPEARRCLHCQEVSI